MPLFYNASEELLQLTILKPNLINIGGCRHINSWEKLLQPQTQTSCQLEMFNLTMRLFLNTVLQVFLMLFRYLKLTTVTQWFKEIYDK